MSNNERRILQAVAECGSDAYTLTVWRRLGGREGGFLQQCFGASIVALSLHLAEMEERGWVASSAGRPTPERGMRPKRLWWLTGEGRREMEGPH